MNFKQLVSFAVSSSSIIALPYITEVAVEKKPKAGKGVFHFLIMAVYVSVQSNSIIQVNSIILLLRVDVMGEEQVND